MSKTKEELERENEELRKRQQEKDNFTDSVIIGGVTDSAIIGGLLGGDTVGGVVGDLLDFDLFD